MNRVKLIREYGDVSTLGETLSLFNAFVQCLSAEDACAALDLSFEQDFPKRRSILRKIQRDCENNFNNCHRDLINDLIDAVEQLPYRKKQSCGHALSYLYDGLPSDLQDYLLRFFLGSRYVGYRRRGYKKLRVNWDEGYADLIEQLWATHHDAECAMLLIDQFPPEDLESIFDSLEHEVQGTWHYTKLYLRTASENPDYLHRLAQQDEITYAYVLVKLKNRLNEEDAFAIYERNKYDERLGLLLWCLGQMGHWSVLEHVGTEIHKISYERLGIEYPEYA